MGATIQLEVSGMEFSPDLHKVIESLTEDDKRDLAKELLRKALLEKSFHTEWVESETQKWAAAEREAGKRIDDYEIRRYRERLEDPIKSLRTQFINQAFEMAKSECQEALKSDENAEFFRQVKEAMVKCMPDIMVQVMTNLLIAQVSGAANQIACAQGQISSFNYEMNEIRGRLGMPMKG